RRHDVVGRLAARLDAVVAGLATAVHLVMREACRRHPAGRRMALLAVVRTGDMTDSLAAGTDPAARAVAAGAVARRAPEDRIDVAGLARRDPVLAGELEPGGEVVERRPRRRGPGDWHETGQGQD